MRKALLCGMLTLLTNCLADGPREVPFPVLDARAPFPELSGRRPQAAPAKAKADGTGFEEALAELDALEPERPPEDEGDETPHRDVAVRNFTAQIPVGAEWTTSTSGGATTIAYQPAGAPEPLAIIYTEPFGPMVQMSPSAELRRFLQKIDRELLPSIALVSLPQAGGAVAPIDWAFESTRKSFTGWRWVGKNRHDVELRIARVTGSWVHNAPQQQPAQLQDVLDELPIDLGELGIDLSELEQLQELGGEPGSFDDAPAPPVNRTPARAVPAWMVFGNARVSDSNGFHVAIVCNRSGGCPVAAMLSDFLDTVQP